jgi:hypothetical protein
MSADICELPVWNTKATASERFRELARMADLAPERFNQVVVVWDDRRGGSRIDFTFVNIDTVAYGAGFIEMGKLAMLMQQSP